jgi:hypothetical protein
MNKNFFLIAVFSAVIGVAWSQTPPCEYREIVPIRLDDMVVAHPQIMYPVGGDDDDEVKGYRNIFFIHGLGGDASAWTKAAEACWNSNLERDGLVAAFPARKCLTFQLEYTALTKGSIDAAANKVGQDIREKAVTFGADINPNTAILIAHSQGGMVCRALMDLDFVTNAGALPSIGRGYGGLVTIASPLQGAYILNSKNAGGINKMARDACNSLLAGPTSHSIVPLVMKIMGIKTDNVCVTVSGNLLDVFFASYHDDITKSYTVGAAKINDLNIHATDPAYPNFIKMPKVAFFAVEPQTNIMWRTANWLLNNPNDATYFGAINDFAFFNNTICPIYDSYRAYYEMYKKKTRDTEIALKATWWTVIGGLVTSHLWKKYRMERDAWQEGVHWFDNANTQWESIIGARTYDKQTNKWITKPKNDGIVLAESAMNLPGATHDPVEIFTSNGRVRIGSSHMQVRNDLGLKLALKDLFDGKYGKFFQTEEK